MRFSLGSKGCRIRESGTGVPPRSWRSIRRQSNSFLPSGRAPRQTPMRQERRYAPWLSNSALVPLGRTN
jgi:hypothetical protein